MELPTREQIEAIADLEALQDLHDDVVRCAEQIKADLEFRSDDGATDEWERRARGALAAHNITIGQLNKRIHFVRKAGKQHPTPPDHAAKARKQEAIAARVAAEVEARKVKAEQDREKTLQKMLEFASKQSLLLHFHKVASEQLDSATMREITVEAERRMKHSLAVDGQPTNAHSSRHAGAA